jgi:uncharacterized membrane protein YcfT
MTTPQSSSAVATTPTTPTTPTTQRTADRDAPPTSRLQWVDAAKGMCILLVVAHHTLWFLASTGQAPAALVAANSALASLRMPLFFLASGLFAARPLTAPWRTLLHKRVALFLYLYVLWTLVRFAFFLALPGVVDPYDSADPVALALALVLPGPGMWFLYALALFAVVGKLIRRVPVAVQLAGTGALSAVVGAGIVEFDSFAWTFMARYLFFFLLGVHAPRLAHRLAASTRPVTVALAGAACAGGAAAAVALDVRSVPGVALALNLLAVTFGILFAAWIARHRIGMPLVVLGRHTLPVYLMHVLLLAVVMAGVQHLQLPAVAEYVLPVVLAIGLTALSLGTCQLLALAGANALFGLPSRLAHRPPRHALARVRPPRPTEPVAAVAIPAQRTIPLSRSSAAPRP